VALKRRGVKVSIGLGGWNDSAGDKYSRMVNNRSSRKKFIDSIINFIKKYDFDGLDFDWEYPKCWQVISNFIYINFHFLVYKLILINKIQTNCDQGPDSDKKSFSNILMEIKQAFEPYGYLLSAAVSPSKGVIDSGEHICFFNHIFRLYN